MKKIFNILTLLSFVTLFSQVGINTHIPLGKLHIDSKKNTIINNGDPINTEDDVIITSEGKVGIGKIPDTKLEINSLNETLQSTLRLTQLSPDSPIPSGPKQDLG